VLLAAASPKHLNEGRKVKYAISILVFVLMFAHVMAVDVDCGYGDSLCRESELQDEFDEVTDDIDENSAGIEENAEDIDELQEAVEDNAEGIQENSDAIADLEEDVEENSEDIDALEDAVDENAENIEDNSQGIEDNADDIDDLDDEIGMVAFGSMMGDKILRHYSDWKDWLLRQHSDASDAELEALAYEQANKAMQYADENDGRGVSFRTVLRYLMTDYIDYLKGIFMTQKAADTQQEKLYELEARLNLCGCDGYTQAEYDQQYLTIKAIDTGTKQCSGEMCCYPDGLCLQ
jgi:DNA repair exonuclease SbcCD ATPase subunit